MSITVTFTGSGGFAGTGGTNSVPKLRVLTFSGASSPSAQLSGGGHGSNDPNTSITQYSCSIPVQATNSYVVGSLVVGPSGQTITALANSTILDSIQDSTNNLTHGSFISSAKTSATGSATYGSSLAFGSDGVVACCEILQASGQTLTRQTSREPAVVNTTTANSVTTASFTPNSGDLLVALVDGLEASSGTVSDSSSMTWTKIVDDTVDGYAGIFVAQVASGVTGSAALTGSGTLTATPNPPVTITNSFEGGTSGSAISTSNSGGTSGTAWDALGGSTTLPVYSTAAGIHGGLGASTPLSGNSTTTIEWKAAAASLFNSGGIPWYARDYFEITSLPPAQVFLMKAQDDAVPQDVWAVYLDTTGHLGLRNRIAGTNLATSTGTVALSTPTRWETQCIYTGSAYSLTLRCFFGSNVEGTTPDETLTGSISTADAVDVASFGAQAATVQTWSTVYHDDILLTNVGWPGPAAVSTMSGTGSLTASPAMSPAVAFSGQGTLTGTESTGQALAMSGIGTVGASSTFLGAATLAGLGSINVTVSWPATMSGAGTFAASPAFGGSLAMTGVGTLATAETWLPVAHLTGTGLLAAPNTFTGAAALTGTGSLSAADQFTAAAALSGLGVLTGSGSVAGGNLTLALTGAGTLTASGVLPATAILTGLGGSLAGAGVFAGSAPLSGAGSLSAAFMLNAGATLSGQGVLAATGVLPAAAVLSGVGSIAAVSALPSVVTLSGSGLLLPAVSILTSSLLSGLGSLSATPVSNLPGAAVLSGQGSLATSARLTFNPVVTISGTGVLQALWAMSATAQMSGVGSLAGSSLQIILAPPAVMSGAGVFTAIPTVIPVTVAYLWHDYEIKRDKFLKLKQFLTDSEQAGAMGMGARAFTEAYEADQVATAAYEVWLAASGAGLPVQ